MISLIIITSSLLVIGNSCEQQVNCVADPCRGETCKNDKFINATCVPDYCFGCNTKWIWKDEDVSDQCNCDGTVHECDVNPCNTSSCPNYPDAECQANYCDGCNAIWFVNIYIIGIIDTK